MSLVAEADKLLAVLDHQPLVYESLGKIRRQLGPQELEKLDQEWLHLGEDKGPLAEVLAHPISVQLRLIKEDDRRIGEILVTDRFGQLVAATNRTSDFYQADEEWWQLAWDKGKGRIYIPPIGYDASSGVWSIDLCMPIRDPKTAEVVGVVKAVIDVSQWFGDLSQLVGNLSLSAMLLRSDGTVIYRSGMTVPTIEEESSVPIPRIDRSPSA